MSLTQIRQKYPEKIVSAERKIHLSLKKNLAQLYKYHADYDRITSGFTNEELQHLFHLSEELRHERHANQKAKQRANERRRGLRAK